MNKKDLELPDDPSQALARLEAESRSGPVIVFKKSPICPVSTMAEGEFTSWLATGSPPSVTVAMIDVIARRGLARGLTSELGIRHESPQALLFNDGALAWHDSHGGLVVDAFEAALTS